jgi:hypothetical protein
MDRPDSQGSVQYPQARWRLERVGDNRIDLLVWTQPDTDRYTVTPMRFPMTAGEAFDLVSGGDRVVSWASAAADGTMTSGIATPDEVRQHLAICGYIVISPDIGAHTRMVSATPWANWVEEVPAPQAGSVAWFVNVFAADDAEFSRAAVTHGAERRPTVYAGGPDAG